MTGAVQEQERRPRLRAAFAVRERYRRLVQHLQVEAVRQLVPEAVHGSLRVYPEHSITVIVRIALHVSRVTLALHFV